MPIKAEDVPALGMLTFWLWGQVVDRCSMILWMSASQMTVGGCQPSGLSPHGTTRLGVG